MTGFLRWLRSIMAAVLNGIAKFAFLSILIFAVLVVIGLAEGDGLPKNTVLTLDLRDSIADSAATGLSFSGTQQTVMNLVFALDNASRDSRIKGVVMRLGNGALSLAEAEEISAALHRFRDHGKFVIAQATGNDPVQRHRAIGGARCGRFRPAIAAVGADEALQHQGGRADTVTGARWRQVGRSPPSASSHNPCQSQGCRLKARPRRLTIAAGW